MEMKQGAARAGWVFWVMWVLATTMGGVVAYSAAFDALYRLLEQGVASVTAVALGGALFGLLVGAAQWLVLYQHFFRAGLWIIATLVGGALGGLTTELLQENYDSVETFFELGGYAFLVYGQLLGAFIAQWLVLRTSVKRAVLWIPVNALAFLIPAVGNASLGVESIVLMLVYASITGLLLVWLVHHPVPTAESSINDQK